MGRKKLEMKKIENLQARRQCFSKRRKGLFGKAKKISEQYNLNILSIVFSPAGKPFIFHSGDPSTSFDSMLSMISDRISTISSAADSNPNFPPPADSNPCFKEVQPLLMEVGNDQENIEQGMRDLGENPNLGSIDAPVSVDYLCSFHPTLENDDITNGWNLEDCLNLNVPNFEVSESIGTIDNYEKRSVDVGIDYDHQNNSCEDQMPLRSERSCMINDYCGDQEVRGDDQMLCSVSGSLMMNSYTSDNSCLINNHNSDQGCRGNDHNLLSVSGPLTMKTDTNGNMCKGDNEIVKFCLTAEECFDTDDIFNFLSNQLHNREDQMLFTAENWCLTNGHNSDQGCRDNDHELLSFSDPLATKVNAISEACTGFGTWLPLNLDAGFLRRDLVLLFWS